jgi:hypothetical protein
VNLVVQVAMGVALIAGAFLARALHLTRDLPSRGVAPESGNDSVRHAAILSVKYYPLCQII